MKVISTRLQDERNRYFGPWLETQAHDSLHCVRKQDGYGWWHNIVLSAERRYFVFDYVIARVYGNEVHLHHPQYFADIELLVQRFEEATGAEVTVKVFES